MLDNEKTSFSTKLFAYLIRFILETILFTCKIKIKGGSQIEECFKKGPTMIILWHNRLALVGTLALRATKEVRFCAFVSNSKDGEILAQYTTSYKRGSTIRVPHDAKDRALKALINRLSLKRDVPILTPDGPKGPRYEMKPGASLAALETNASIIPFSWTAAKYWQLKTWDKLRIPLPFTTIEAEFGAPITLKKEQTAEEQQAILTQALQALS